MWLTNPKDFGAKKCCLLNCTLVIDNMMAKDGPYNTTTVIEKIKQNVTNQAWNPIIEKVVKDCHEAGMKAKSAVDDMSPQCETSNITIALNVTHCIRRELFFNCKDPQMVTNGRCQLLVEYGKICMYFPWECYRQRIHRGDN
jgi:hypothetical protein